MSERRDIRRLAMQVLYQLDLRGYSDLAAIEEGLREDEAIDSEEVVDAAVALAKTAWHKRHNVDELSRTVAPQWPPHRQPAVDRAILRLAHHEMVTGRVPPRIAINEAIKLAQRYSGDKSASFVNAVLDKMARHLGMDLSATDAAAREAGAPPRPATGDAWLDDALQE